MHSAYDEILDFVTSSPTLEEIIAFQHSTETLDRVSYLRHMDAGGTGTQEEKHELREFEKAAYFIDQLKVRAQRRLSRGEK